MAFRIEGYLYKEIDGLRSLSISENGVDVYAFTLSATAPVVAALEDWQTQANASADLSGTYAFSYDDSASLVTLARTDGNFYYLMPGSLSAALGFTYSASLSGAAASFTSSAQPGSICNPISIHHEPPESVVEISKKIRRLGRANIQAHYGARVADCETLVSSSVADVILAGPLFSSRVKLYQDHTTTDPYSTTKTDGTIDGYGHTVESVSRIGFNDGHTRIRWAISVAE